jgi:DNA-binding NarL/FixJ family response regulator
MAIRISVFDDNNTFRKSLEVLFFNAPGFECVGSFENCEGLTDKISLSQPDVILMDIEMPGINGIEAMKAIKKSFPSINVMMQTAFEDDDKIFASICAGASGYILKNTLPEKILESIVEVYQGGSPMSPSVAKKVLGFMQNPIISKLEKEKSETDLTYLDEYKLTQREKDVLQCLIKGMSYKMIADNLFISYETVRSHMKKIYQKLHVASMTEAVAKIMGRK